MRRCARLPTSHAFPPVVHAARRDAIPSPQLADNLNWHILEDEAEDMDESQELFHGNRETAVGRSEVQQSMERLESQSFDAWGDPTGHGMASAAAASHMPAA